MLKLGRVGVYRNSKALNFWVKMFFSLLSMNFCSFICYYNSHNNPYYYDSYYFTILINIIICRAIVSFVVCYYTSKIPNFRHCKLSLDKAIVDEE